MIGLVWILFGSVVLGILLVSFLFVKWFSDRYESEALPTLVTTISLAVVLFSVFLVPVDIYVASSGTNSRGAQVLPPSEVKSHTEIVKLVYYILFAIIPFLCLLVIPFTYFYYEEKDTEITTRDRICAGAKYTSFLVAIVLVMFVAGIFIGANPSEFSAQYMKQLLQQNFLERTLGFGIGCISILGYTAYLTYTAIGFSALPIGLIKGRRRVSDEREELRHDRESLQEEQRRHASKYLGGGRQVPEDDAARISLLRDREQALVRREEKLTAVTESFCFKLGTVFAPFRILIGAILLLWSLLLVVSIVLTQVDRLANNYCGARCGFLLKYNKIFNPMDKLLVFLSAFFPVDYVVFTVLVVYFFFTTLGGVVSLGIRLMCILLYKIEYKRTAPQALLLATVILMFALISMNFQLLSIVPQYAQFGSQKYYNATTQQVLPCTADPDIIIQTNCTMTQIGQIVNRMSISVGIMGEITYWVSWAFAGMFLLGLVFCLLRKGGNITTAEELDDDA